MNQTKESFHGTAYENSSFFLTAELQQRLYLVTHLLEFGQQILVVHGPTGIGKSHFCNNVRETLDRDWVIFQTSADEKTSPDNLIRSLIRESDFELDNVDETINALGQFLAYCHHNDKKAVLFIDKADKLTHDTLKFIFRFTDFKEESAYIRVVLIGSDSYLDTLKQSGDENISESQLHSISLAPFTLQQTTEFLNHLKLHTDPLTEKEISRIYKVSAGIPADIRFLAEQGLNDPALNPAKNEKQQSAESTVRTRRIVIAAMFVLVIVSVIFALNMPDTTDIKVPEVVKLDLPTTTSLNSDVDIEKTALDEPLPDAWMDEQNVGSDSAEIVDTPVAGLVEEPEPVADLELIQIDSKALISPQAATSKTDLSMRDKSWLMQQKDEDFVLQLIGAVEMKTIENFIDTVGLEKSLLTLLSTRKNGADWHVLSYGLYADIEAARSAINTLPEAAKAHKPWPNAVKSLKASLKKPGQEP